MSRRPLSGIGGWRIVLAIAVVVVGLAGVAVSHGAESAAPLKLRFGGDPTQTRVVLELDRPARAEVISDGAADGHVVLSFSELKVGDDLDGRGRGIVTTWNLEKGLARTKLSLELSRPGRIKRRFLLPPGDGVASYRYVMDIEATGTDAAPPSSQIKAQKASDPAPSDRVEAKASKLTAPKVIVIDAGHGGHDPGALGGRSHEKDITLAAAEALKARLERSGRFKVVLTRQSDVYIPLETRVKIARSADADLFISLHADSGGDPKVRGATVYTLSDHGVDRATRSVFGGGFIDVELPGRDLSVKQILLDLTQRSTRNRSGAFAETLLEHISTQTPLLRRSHRDAGYMVLLAPDVPAVLLEMGFITSPEDEAQLLDPEHRTKMMSAVGDAIEAYFAEPPAQVAER